MARKETSQEEIINNLLTLKLKEHNATYENVMQVLYNIGCYFNKKCTASIYSKRCDLFVKYNNFVEAYPNGVTITLQKYNYDSWIIINTPLTEQEIYTFFNLKAFL